MFVGILNNHFFSSEDAEKKYLNTSKNHNHYLARELICFEIKNFFSTPYAPIIQNENGEISLIDSNFKISVSHKEEHFALALSSVYEAIGVDLEYFNNNVDWSVFHGRFFNTEDWLLAHQLASIKEITLSQVYTLLFSAKESVLKTTKLKIDPLKIKFIIFNFFNYQNKIQLTTCLKWENYHLDFLIDVMWMPASEKNWPSVLSVSVIKEPSNINEGSLFNDLNVKIIAPSIFNNLPLNLT